MKRIGLTRSVIVLGAILIAVAAATSVTTLIAVTNQRDTSADVRSADQRVALANELERRIIDLETGARGFVITQQTVFLQPRNEALRVLPVLQRHLVTLEQNTASRDDIALLHRLFGHLHSYVNDYLNPLIAHVNFSLGSARAIVSTGEGKRRVDKMRRLLTTYTQRETSEADAESAKASTFASDAVLIAIVGLVAVPLLILMMIWGASRSVAVPIRRMVGATKRLRGGDLTVQVPETGATEVRELAAGFNAMATSIQHSRDELESQNAELEAQQGELERSVEELAEERDRIQRFYDFVSRLAEQQEIQPLGEVLLDELTKVAAADAGTLYAIEPAVPGAKDRLRLVASRGFDRGHLAEAIERGHGLAGRAIAEETVIEGNHGDGGLELPAFGQSVKLKHEIHIPLGRRGATIGVVSLAKLDQPGFSAEQKDRLLNRAGPAAVALANALSLEASDRVAALNLSILDSAQDSYIAVDEDGVVLAWNPKATELYGVSSEDAIGRQVAEVVFPDDPEDKAASDERRRAILAAATRGEGVERYEVEIASNGHPRQMEVSAAGVQTPAGGVVTYFSRDITDRAHREQEHGANEAVSRVLAEADRDEDLVQAIIAALCHSFDWPAGGFWEYDERERLVRCRQIFIAEDFEFPELAQFSREIVYVPGEALPIYPLLKEAWDAGEPRWDAPKGKATPDEPRAVAHSAGLRASLALPVKSGGEMLGLLTFGSKTDQEPDRQRLAALRSITDLIGQVMERRAAQREAERLKDEFFALVSHELRTPLTSIVGYLDIVRDGEAGPVNEEQRRFLGVIDRNAKRLMRLVGDLLFVAQIEAGKLNLKRGAVDLEAVVLDAVEAGRPRAEKQGLLLATEAEPVELAGGDADRLGQLVDNLVSNAIKFTPEGGSVTVRLQRTGERAVLEVIDTGMGISEQDQKNLFNRFYRTKDASKMAIPGIGLGLSISKAIVEGHGGAIKVSSQEGHGTTFRVELPLREAVASHNGDRAPEAQREGAL